MSTQRIDILSKEILHYFSSSTKGHCARVDFLPRDEANAICHSISQMGRVNTVKTYVLANGPQTTSDAFTISTDYAIELRNRKQESLCLFVPIDIVDATASSLSNSFAIIDGRILYAGLLRQLRASLSPQAQKVVQSVFNQLKGLLKIGTDQQINYINAVLELEKHGQLDQAGCELWRVGLIADRRPATGESAATFMSALDNNKRCVRAITRPTRLQATLSSQLKSLLVDEETERKLIPFFRSRSLQDIRTWSQALVTAQLTFDQWRFPEEDHSDIKSVTIQRFLDSSNKVEKYTRLAQPRGVGTSLQAICGSKSTLIVRWKVDPPHPRNLKYWRVELLPSGASDDEGEQDTSIDLPSREIPASRSNLSIPLDFELERALAVVVRVTPIEMTGQPGKHPETQDPIRDESDEFFLMPENDTISDDGPDLPLDKHTDVTTIALGRLEQAMQTKANTIEETSPQWSLKELDYFSLRLDNKKAITLGLSPALKEIEVRSLRSSRQGGMFQLNADEIRSFPATAFLERYLTYGSSPAWKSFWNAREAFFKQLRQSDPRHVIEVAQWTPDLTNVAVRYVQNYQILIQALAHQVEQSAMKRHESLQELKEAMSLDTIIIRIRDGLQRIEESLVVLPIHPLRVAWLVGYNQLLGSWEEQIFERTKAAARKGAIDLASLRLLAPINIPAFAFHADSPETYVFFQNVRFYHAVMLPVGVPDPHRRYSEIATILGASSDQIAIGTIQPAQLARHLVDFVTLHPYINTLVSTLVNPDRGDFFAEALKQLVQSAGQPDDDDSSNPKLNLSSFQVTAYVEDEQKSSVQSLNRVRQTQIEHFNNSGGSSFLPGLSITLRDINQLKQAELPDAHITVISDFTRPSLSTYIDAKEESDARSFTLYGLICRFVPLLKKDAEGIIWRYQILPERLKPSEAHPVKAQYSDILMHLYTTLLEASSQLLDGIKGSLPVLEVRLDEERRSLLEQLHQNSNWVITLDRFFALDYYDSPHIEGLDEMARKYVLDYSPEFSEGLGHRLMITTSWHEEIGSLLRQAMEEHGLAAIENSVSHLLHHLKIVSGSLALQALESKTSASAAVGLSLVTAWLLKKKRLRQSILVPVDLHPRLFARDKNLALPAGERRCDLALFSLKRNIVDITFIEVKWRRGRVPFERLGEDMYLQMHSSRRIFEERFFHAERIDGALQRSHLGNVLRFYFDRSRRYQLFDEDAEHTFLERIAELEKTGLSLRWHYEGYIVSLDQHVAPFDIKEAKIRVLTASDFDTTMFPMNTSFTSDQESLLSDDLLAQESIEPEESVIDQDDLLSHVIQKRRTGTLTLMPNENAIVITGDVIDEQLPSNPLQKITQAGDVMVSLGTSVQGGECQWHPSVKGSPHLFIVGIPGQGKSWATTRLLIELSQQHVPALVLDFHSQFSNPEEPFARQVQPNVLDVARGLPFSPFECAPDSDESDVIANSLEVAEIFAHVTNLGPIQQDTLYRALQSAYQENGFGREHGSEKLEYPTLESVLEHIKSEGKGRNNVDLILARCRSLLEMNLFRPQQHDLNLLEQIRNGLVLDLHRVPEQIQQAAGAFILRKLYKDMFRWGSTDHLRLTIVLDEAHRLAKDVTLPKIMKEGRKFGVLVIVASQELTDFHQGIIGNVGTKIIFRVNHPDSRKVAGLLQAPMGVDLARQISQLSIGNAYVQTPEMPTAAKIHMHPLV